MQKFIALYKVPVAVLDGWMSKSAEERKEEEGKMQKEWAVWMEKNKEKVLFTVATGKPKVVMQSGVVDDRNDIMMYSLIEAENHETASEVFVGHPHLQIPEASIEVMSVRNI